MMNMNKKNNDPIKDPIDLINRLKPMEAKKSKEQVWAEMEILMSKPLPAKGKIWSLNIRKWSMAASITLFVSLSILASLRFYTKTVSCLPGKTEIATLPDGSTVQLNAQSTLSFHPLWWKINRAVNLEGEGFFKVKKGEKFTVVSTYGTTSVMGTSFNIFSRDEDYEVTCLTGKVKVVSLKNNEEIMITPNQMVKLENSGKINANLSVDASLAIDWTKGKFVFTRVPLHKVLSEIARRYDVKISQPENLDQLYTGNFKQEAQVEDVLAYVCKPNNIEYKKLPSGEFVIQQAP